MINKEKLVYDTTDGGDQVASYIKSASGTIITHTTVGGKESLDVNVANTVAISATDLDIRDLSHTQDSVKVGDGTDFLAINADGSINATVSATNLDIRDLAFATDKVDVSGSSVTVTATDLDIRDLTAVSDSVKIGDGLGVFATFHADTGMNVHLTNAADIQVATNSEYAEDSASAGGDIGNYVLSIRQDTLASSTSASGDFQSFKTDALGRLWMNDTNQSMAHSAVSVTNTATDLVASDLANRKRILIQNKGNKDVFLGGASVTAANGIRLASGSSAELDIGPGVDIHGITSSGSSDVRIMELA